MSDIEQSAREQLAEGLRASYPDDIARRHVIRQLLADELDLINARVAVRTLAAALTPPEGYVLVPVELLRMVIGCAYPVSTVIDPRGYRWSEAYLDQALPHVKAALLAARLEVSGG